MAGPGKGRLSAEADEAQQAIENPLAVLGAIRILLAHDDLRIRQAIQRTGLRELLEPVLEHHERIAAALDRLQEPLAEVWREGQEKRWNT